MFTTTADIQLTAPLGRKPCRDRKGVALVAAGWCCLTDKAA